MKKRILSMVLALVMCGTVSVFGVSADNADSAETTAVTETATDNDSKVGGIAIGAVAVITLGTVTFAIASKKKKDAKK